MKKIIFSTLAMSAFILYGCDNGQTTTTERTVLDSDTVSVEKEYEVENKIREKTVKIDTITETETVESEQDLENQNRN